MSRLSDALRVFIRLVVRQVWTVVLLALVVSVVGFWFARQLRIDTDFSNLVPRDYPSVQALEALRETVGSEATVDVAIVSPSFEANKAFAEQLIPRALALAPSPQAEPYLNRVDFEKDTAFLEQNALYFATYAELDSLESYLRDKIRDAKLDANPFFFDLDDEEDESDDETAYDPERDLQEVYDHIIGKRYPVNEDSTIMALRFYPSGSQTDIGFIETLYDDLDALIVELTPTAYHPEMKVAPAGRLLRQLVEVRTISEDVLGSFAAGVTAVLLLVVGYFFYKGYTARAGHRFSRRVLIAQLVRIPVLAGLIGIPLLMSLSWTLGVAWFAFGKLNMMTSTLGLVLFGLGIDYGIHFYARYTEERSLGRTAADAAESTFTSTGKAIALGAFTTAAALYVLTGADFRGFSEFGFIAGTGILFAVGAMTIVMPALLILFERYRLLNFEVGAGVRTALQGYGRIPGARGLVLGSMGLVIAALVFLPRVGFQYDFGALDPVYEEYDAKRNLIGEVYPSRGRNPAYVLVDDPSEAPAVEEAIERHAQADTLSPTIDRAETLQERFPMVDEEQQHKLDRIAEIRALLADPFVEADTDEGLARVELAAGTVQPLTIEQLPESIRNRFISKTGELGGFIVIYPSVGLADGRASMAFADDVGKIVTEDGSTYYAGSPSIVAADMLRLMRSDAPWMMAGALIMVILIMWINFRAVRWVALATAPLVVGVLWMILVIELVGLQLNFYNMIVLPAILGIGNDAGVHLVHRYQEEGPGSIRRVLRYTGEHIAMGSFTTMIGFAGLLLSFHPGLHSIGELAVVGIGATLLAALLFLPAALQWLEDRRAPAVVDTGAS